MRKFLPRGKFWIFNTRRGSTSVPAPFARRGWSDRRQKEVERQTVAGTRRNFIFLIFYPRAAIRWGRWVQPTESRVERGRKKEGKDPVGRREFPIRDAASSNPRYPSSPLWRPSSRVLPRDAPSGPPRGLDVFDESIRGYFRYANSLPTWGTLRLLHTIATPILFLSLTLFTLAKPVDSTSAWRRINVVKAAPLRPSSRYFGGEVSGVPRSLGRRTFSNEVARKLLPTIPLACDLRLRCFSAKAPCSAIRNLIPPIVKLFVEKSRKVWTRIWPGNKLEFLECRIESWQKSSLTVRHE